MICYIKSKFIHLRFTYIYRILKIIAVGYKEHNACEGAAFEECDFIFKHHWSIDFVNIPKIIFIPIHSLLLLILLILRHV
jgi:hypothetical protein